MKITNLTTLLLAVLITILGATTAHASERWYNVEVIIFAHNNEAALSEENWPVDPGIPDSTNSVTLITDIDEDERLPGQIIEFEKLDINMLGGALSRLKRSSRYDVKYASAWRLPDLPVKLAPPVRIKAGQRFTAEGNPAPPPPVPTHTQTIVGQVVGQDQLPAIVDDALYEIDGRIKISLSKYLDVDADLVYRSHVFLPDADGVPTRTFQSFRLTEFRRMRSKTIHYLDHPLFGMIIGIDRYERPDEELLPVLNEIKSSQSRIQNQRVVR